MSYRSVGYDRGGRDGYDRGGRDGYDRGGRDGYDRGGRDGYDRGGRGGYDRGGRDGYDRGGRDGYNRGGRDGYNRGGRGGGSFRGGNDTGGRGRGRGGGFRGQSAPLPPPKLDGEGAIFPLSVKAGTKAYRYDVSIIFFTTDRDGNELQVDLTDKKRDNRMREVCYQIISVVYEETHDFGVRDLEIVYDNQNTLYTPRRFKPLSYDVEKTQLPTDIQSYITGSGSLKVTITQNAEMPEVDISNMEQYQSRELLLTENQTVRQVLEMILSQNALNSGEYNFVGDGQLYRIRSDPIERGLCTRNGIHKGVRIIDYNGKVTPALVIDIKRSPFYEVCDNFLTNVKKFVTEPNNRRQWEDADEFFKNLKVYPVYASHRILKFSGFTKKDVKDITVNLEDGPVSMAQFFRSKKGITLQNTNYPAMIAANGAGEFPLEVLRVLPNQHVNLEHVSDFLRNQVHRRNSVEPEKRYNAILEELRGLEIRSNVTKAFGIDFLSTENKTVTVLRFNRPKKPTIMLGGGATVQPAFDGRFDLGMSPYLKPAEIGRWGVMHALSSGRDGCDPAVIKNFVVNFERAARARGIKFTGSALIMEFDSSAPFNVWDEKFKFFKEKQASFIILIDTKTPRSSNSHGFLKLFESLYKVLTQHITYKIACDVADNRSRQTLANILHKTNVKNGGINYKPMFENVGPLDINSGKVLVIAYDVSHPGGLIPEEDVQKQTKKPDQDKRRNDSNDSPSVVGLVANIVEDPASFVGDFFYQEARREAVNGDELRVYVKRFLEQLKKNRPNKPLPSTIVVLRDGVSEGQFRMVFEEELPRIRSACTDFDSKYKPKFVFALTTKRHHKRFFEGGSGSAIVNPAAGSFVDSAVVRPDCDEFYMACHKTIKGTAKFVQVSVICNEPQVKLTEIKSFLHSLSYGHQIVTSPVSLPTPVYQADVLATRGREVFNVCRKYAPTRFEHVDGHINYTLASHMLNYTSSNLGNIRFNA